MNSGPAANGNSQGRIARTESFNQIVRGVCVLALVGGLIYGFIVSKVVSTESFLIVANTALVWWFRSRDESKAAASAAPPPSVVVSGAPPPG